MPSKLASTVRQKLEVRFPLIISEQLTEEFIIAAFSPLYPEFGAVVVEDNNDEVTVFIGNFTHIHFACYESDITEEAAATQIAEDTIEFLEDLFADQILCYVTQNGGGFHNLKYKERRESEELTGFLWSHPVN